MSLCDSIVIIARLHGFIHTQGTQNKLGSLLPESLGPQVHKQVRKQGAETWFSLS